MARFMLSSRWTKPSMFPGVCARSNAPLNIQQLCRFRSNPLFSSNRSKSTSFPQIPLQPSIIREGVWIDIKAYKKDDSWTSWPDLAKEIYDDLPLDGEDKPIVILSASSVTESPGSFVCSYDGRSILANAVSIYTTFDPAKNGYLPYAVRVADKARDITLKYLDGETFIKIKHLQLIEAA